MGSASAFVIRWINFFTMLHRFVVFPMMILPRAYPILSWHLLTSSLMLLYIHMFMNNLLFVEQILALLVVGFGFWMSTHNDECRRTLTVPVIALGGVIFLISLVGFLGAWKNISCLLWTYLITLFVVLVAIMVFTVLAFIITNTGTGHTVPGARYKEYRLQDYSSWFVKQLDDTEKWNRLKSCLVKSDDCNNLSKRYKTLKEYKLADLTPMESGCCRPPAECGYPALNASYFDLSYHPVSTNADCKLYKNTRSVRCYDCNSCKAGVAQYMKTEWRVVAIFNVILFIILSFVYFVGCCARRNAGGSDGKGHGRR